ncbi:MAG: hypothetical protein MI725_01830 [Pirellulales bacterium]|nr:hypothetical protein [Pirellulales bacterium]
MSDTKVPSIIDQLQSEEESLVTAAEELRRRLSKTEVELERVRTARKALVPKQRTRRASRKQAPTREDVKQAIALVVKAKGNVNTEQLRLEVAEAVAAQGFSQVGYSLRFNEALAELGITKQPTDKQPTPTGQESR